jgi:hypothetical protein
MAEEDFPVLIAYHTRRVSDAADDADFQKVNYHIERVGLLIMEWKRVHKERKT